MKNLEKSKVFPLFWESSILAPPNVMKAFSNWFNVYQLHDEYSILFLFSVVGLTLGEAVLFEAVDPKRGRQKKMHLKRVKILKDAFKTR